MILADVPPTFLATLAVVYGLFTGSFLNVVIYRVPLGMNIAFPASHCPACGTPIHFYDNVPVLSYVLLGGRTRCCKVRYSPRYPIVEALGGLLSYAVFHAAIRPLPPGTSLGRAAAIYASEYALTMGLLAAAFIDAEHMFLPDPITLGGAILGLGTASLRDMTYATSLLGAVVGFLVVWAPFVLLYEKVRGRHGMGMGDAKLTMLAGAWFGWRGALFVLFAGALQGTLGALIIYGIRGKIEEPAAVKADREELQRLAAEGDDEARQALADDPLGTEPEAGLGKARLPFGPFLILACLEYLLAGPRIEALYRGLLGP